MGGHLSSAPIPEPVEKLAAVVVDAAFRVHTQHGPGFLQSVDDACLVYGLSKRGVTNERQVGLPVVYDDFRLEPGLRLDLLAERLLSVERKAVEPLSGPSTAQALTYLKLTGKRLASLIIFNVPRIKDGFRRFVL